MPERIRYYYELVDRAASARTVVSTRDQLSDAILVRTPRCPTLPEDSPVHSRVVLIAPSQLSQQQCHALDSPCTLQHPALNCIANAAAVTVSNSARRCESEPAACWATRRKQDERPRRNSSRALSHLLPTAMPLRLTQLLRQKPDNYYEQYDGHKQRASEARSTHVRICETATQITSGPAASGTEADDSFGIHNAP